MTAILSRALSDCQRPGQTAIVLAGALLLAQTAFAQDALRGSFVTPPAYMPWAGFYGGAQMDYKSADTDFSDALKPLTDFMLRNSDVQDNVAGWTTLKNGSTTGNGYGGFVGYNWQWDDVVFGVEANYSRSSLTKGSSDSLNRLFVDSSAAPPNTVFIYDLTVAGSSTIKLTDLATARARIGWATGTLLPYGFIGFAVGRADVTNTASVTGSRTEVYTPPCPDPIFGCPPSQTTLVNLTPRSQTETKKGAFVYGGALGLGFDWALAQNLFLRGEWELVQLQEVQGVEMRINTGRVALGLKF